MNFDDISSLLSGLSEEDMANLSAVAEQFLGGEEKPPDTAQPDLFGGIDPQMLAKLTRLMPLLQSSGENERTRLIAALKPLLSPARRRKADEAAQLMRLMDMLPMIREVF